MSSILRQNRIAGLDGLRAFSVMVVFLHHTGLVPIYGGYIGVDIFFVLSGYLITTILVKEYDKNKRISLSSFYMRRAKRLYPALLFFLFSMCLYISVFKPKISIVDEIFPSLMYYMNWIRAFGIYDASLTGHTWSLAIEEQYYLLWPLVLTVLLNKRLRSHIVPILIVLISALVFWRVYLYSIGATAARTYCGFDTHSDGLLVGALLAVIGPIWIERVGKAWVLGMIYLLFVLTTKAGDDFAVTAVGFFVTAVSSAVVIAKVVTNQNGPLTRLLEWKPFVRLGVMSYGFYLWHYVVIRIILYNGHDQFLAFFGSFAYPRPLMLISTFLATLAMTHYSWSIVEVPILKLKREPTEGARVVCQQAQSHS